MEIIYIFNFRLLLKQKNSKISNNRYLDLIEPKDICFKKSGSLLY